MSELNNLPDGFNALVVGATGGLGAALAARLAQESRLGRLYVSGRDAAAAGRVADEAATDRVQPLVMDVTEETSIEAAAARIRAEAGRLHLLVNCAGVLHDGAGLAPEKRWEDITPQALEQGFRVNAFGHVLVAKHCLGLMRHGDTAVLANVSARIGSIEDNGLGGWYTYRAAKAAQNQFTRTLAVECGRRARNVICVALHPGTTDTPLSKPFQGRVPAGKLFTPGYSAGCLLDVIGGLTARDNGSFLAWGGQRIPW
ncbi:SDR family NAD(P)-dependent oxidoreductase [Ectothiorhodospiraceae bacterium WFHF3C12]|nr:SDR family NAD(P)-dependent oxidoreductase [Ectothiorhodospiraceae bacterium WFHF3C12]